MPVQNSDGQPLKNLIDRLQKGTLQNSVYEIMQIS